MTKVVSVAEHPDAVAIVGMAGRFPGARTMEAFWHNLCAGVESLTFLSDQDLAAAGVDPAVFKRPNYVRSKFLLDDIELFDASFFGFSAQEAAITDPQHRFFLECAWEALEDAAYDPETFVGPIGIYAGASSNLYGFRNLDPVAPPPELADHFQTLIGNDKDHLTTRVSYKLNLKGPSVTVQTNCSTSLVAVHLACQSLLNGECDMALAGGVAINVPQKVGYLYREGGLACPDGRCRAFDAGAQGTTGSEGLGIVVLKRLADALAGRDHVYAVIRGSAVNNDGAAKVGYVAPGVDGQARAIAEALALARVEPETISYVEAHGSGTPLGDTIEMAALTQAFRASTQKKGFCAIGAVKTNVGYPAQAAGVAGLIKTALALQHKQIPPSLNFERPNPQIDLDNSPFYVNTRLAEWKADGGPRRAGVNAYGVGGTNAHVILEEAPAVEPPGLSRPWQLLLLSARTPAALEAATANLAQHLRQHPQLCLADVAYTLQVGRRAFGQRRALVCRDPQEAASALETRYPGRVFTAAPGALDRRVVFAFPDAQHVRGGAEFYQAEPKFREQVDRCAALLQPHLGRDLRQALFHDEAQVAGQLAPDPAGLAALFVTAYALAQVWIAWGVSPQATLGHGVGEYVAACLAGVLTLQDALRLVVAEGRVRQKLPDEVVLSPLLEDDLHALLAPFAAEAARVNLQAPQIPYLSASTGDWITVAEATDPGYWARRLYQPTDLSKTIGQLEQKSSWVLLEVGLCQAVDSRMMQALGAADGQITVCSPDRGGEQKSVDAALLDVLGQLWLAGVRVDWSAFYARERRRRVSLPGYPFERQRYWLEPPSRDQTHHAPAASAPAIEPGGVYLIPGGLQGVAFALAQCLAQTPQARLVLTDPAPFPERDEWETWLATHGDENDLRRKIQRAQRLEQMGAQVLVLGPATSDRAGTEKALAQAQRRFGEIRAVIHVEDTPAVTL